VGGALQGTFSQHYDVSSDGRFLMNTVVEDTAPAPITIVLNWDSGLKR